MNYLAHAYLSFGHPQILVGNMISDFVKGRQRDQYERQIASGIRLHRSIDSYTDVHPATARAKEIFRPHYRLYSGAFVDIAYDHFLANDAAAWEDEGLHPFSVSVYSVLQQYHPVLPPAFQKILPFMQSQNWLYGYKDVEGMQNSFRGLVRRAAYMNDSTAAYAVFLQHYDELRTCYTLFFEDVKKHAKAELAQLL